MKQPHWKDLAERNPTPHHDERLLPHVLPKVHQTSST